MLSQSIQFTPLSHFEFKRWTRTRLYAQLDRLVSLSISPSPPAVSLHAALSPLVLLL